MNVYGGRGEGAPNGAAARGRIRRYGRCSRRQGPSRGRGNTMSKQSDDTGLTKTPRRTFQLSNV